MQSNRSNRRQLLQGLGAITAASLIGRPTPAQTASKRPFILTVYCGSADGWAGGLLLPNDATGYPRSAFHNGQDAPAANPLMNKLQKTGNLVFHDYNKSLAPIADHLCFCSGNAQTASHNNGYIIQSTGQTKKPGPGGWAATFAQAMHGDASGSALIVSGGSFASQLGQTTPDVARVSGSSPKSVNDQFALPSSTPASDPRVRAYTDIVRRITGQGHTAGVIGDALRNSSRAAIEAVLTGLPELQPTHPVMQQVQQAISQDKVDAIVGTLHDAAGVKADGPSFLPAFQTAAVLALTGRAHGLTCTTSGQDYHTGGSPVLTARQGGAVWAQLVVFWNWVKSVGLQDQVMVVVYHEFSRTWYNRRTPPTYPVMVDGRETEVKAYGTDHHPTFGMVFLNGKVPAGGRVGAIADSLVPLPTKDLRGTPESGGQAYTSVRIFGTMMMRCFPNVFPDYRAVKDLWPNFDEAAIIKPLLA